MVVSELIPSVTQIRYALLTEENEGEVLHSPSCGRQVVVLYSGHYFCLILCRENRQPFIKELF